jgi:hypothetical protein
MSDKFSQALSSIKSVVPPLPTLGEQGGMRFMLMFLTVGWFCLLVKDYVGLSKAEAGKDTTAQAMMIALDSMMMVFCLMYLFIGHTTMITSHKWTTMIVAFLVILYTILWLVQGSPTSWLSETDQFKGSSSFAKANAALGGIFATLSLGYFGFAAFKAFKSSQSEKPFKGPEQKPGSPSASASPSPSGSGSQSGSVSTNPFDIDL